MADAWHEAGGIPGAQPHPQVRRAFSVETQTEFDALTKTVERRVFIKVYAYARTTFANTRYTILPVTGFRFGPDLPDEAMSSGGDMDDTQAMSFADDMGDAGAMSSADDTNKIHGSCAVLPIEDKPKVTPSSGNLLPETLEADVNSARASERCTPRARARAKRGLTPRA